LASPPTRTDPGAGPAARRAGSNPTAGRFLRANASPGPCRSETLIAQFDGCLADRDGLRDVVVLFHLFGTEGIHGNLLPDRQLGNRIGHRLGRAKVDIQLLFLGSLQDNMGAAERPAGRRLARSGLHLDNLSGKRNNLRPDRLPCDTRRVAYSFLGMCHWHNGTEKHGGRYCERYKVSHDDSPIGLRLREKGESFRRAIAIGPCPA
jgi:hypothetical protein